MDLRRTPRSSSGGGGGCGSARSSSSPTPIPPRRRRLPPTSRRARSPPSRRQYMSIIQSVKGDLTETQNEGAPARIPQKAKLYKAERHAIQESQRAAKAAAKEAGISGQSTTTDSGVSPAASKQPKTVKTSLKKDVPQVTPPVASDKTGERSPDRDRKNMVLTLVCSLMMYIGWRKQRGIQLSTNQKLETGLNCSDICLNMYITLSFLTSSKKNST